MPGPTLRSYRPADRAACLDLFGSNMPGSFLPHERAEFVEWLDGLDAPVTEEHAEYTVVEDAGRIVACGGIWWSGVPDGPAGFAWGMVARGLHRHGYGTLLVRARVERLRTLGVAEMMLDTSQHTAPYYARFGFREVGRVPDGYGPGLDRVDMVLRLETGARVPAHDGTEQEDSMKAIRRAWRDVRAEAPVPGVSRRYVHGEQAMVAQFELGAGSVVPWHEHPHEQISVLLSGRLRFEFGSAGTPEVIEAAGGDTVVIPGGLAHQVTVLEDARVYDVFAPPREDWIGARQEATDAG